MASPNIVDIQSLLAPVSEEQPCGEDQRENTTPSSPYQTIKAARNAARAAERKSIHDGNSMEADQHWRSIVESVPQLLKEHSKDIEVASWYTEAMIRLHGAQGLRDAFLILHGLVENFWDSLFPMPDEYGLETRVACLSGLNGEGAEGVLIAPIRKIKITEGNTHGPFSLWEYQQALEAQKLADDKARQTKIANLGFSLDNVESAVEETSVDFLVNLREDLKECIGTYKNLGQLLDEHCGTYDAPPIRTVIEVLEECLGAINHLGRDRFPVEDTEEDSSTDGTEPQDVEKKATAGGGPIDSRESAFRQLDEIARYFRKTEPHSPISYVLEKAVKWGNMPLNDLINELIPDSSSRNHYSELTGVTSNDE